MTGVSRIVRVKSLAYKLRMMLILGKDNGLSQSVSVGYLLAGPHQMFENFIDGVLIEQPPVEGLGLDSSWDVAILVPFNSVPAFFFLVAELIVLHAFPLESERNRNCLRRDQKPVAYRLFQAVVVRRYAVLQIEEIVCVAVYLFLRSRCQADQKRIEIFKDRAILLIDRPMRLINDDQIEVSRTKLPSAVLRLIDESQHGRVGRNQHSR